VISAPSELLGLGCHKQQQFKNFICEFQKEFHYTGMEKNVRNCFFLQNFVTALHEVAITSERTLVVVN